MPSAAAAVSRETPRHTAVRAPSAWSAGERCRSLVTVLLLLLGVGLFAMQVRTIAGAAPPPHTLVQGGDSGGAMTALVESADVATSSESAIASDLVQFPSGSAASVCLVDHSVPDAPGQGAQVAAAAAGSVHVWGGWGWQDDETPGDKNENKNKKDTELKEKGARGGDWWRTQEGGGEGRGERRGAKSRPVPHRDEYRRQANRPTLVRDAARSRARPSHGSGDAFRPRRCRSSGPH